jgi:hypothetical protein
MPFNERFAGSELALVLHDSGVRTGACAGVGMGVTFIAWIVIANRVPSLENFALQRNVIGAAVLLVFFLAPVVRFMWQPGRLLVSSLIAWSILTFAYRALCIYFSALSERFSAVQVFTLGAFVCMILAALSWVGTCIWRVRESHMASHHIPHSNHRL